MKDEIILFSTRSMRNYMQKVARQLLSFDHFQHIKHQNNMLGETYTKIFADGEMEVTINPSIRGKDVYLFTNASHNEAGLSVYENRLELYHTIDALRRAQAGRISVIEPFCSCSRSDRATGRNSVGFWIHYKTLVSLGINHYITYLLHSEKSKTVVDPTLCDIDDLPALFLLKRYITDTFIRDKKTLHEEIRRKWLFCSVDAGGEGIAEKFAQSFGTGLIIAHKQRDYSTENYVEKVDILSSTNIKDKIVWIVDDMIDTAGSVTELVKELKVRSVRKIYITAFHPVFSPPAIERLKKLWKDGLLEGVIVSDSVLCSERIKTELPFLHIVSSASLSAKIILSLNQNASLSKYFTEFDAEEYLSTLKLFF